MTSPPPSQHPEPQPNLTHKQALLKELDSIKSYLETKSSQPDEPVIPAADYSAANEDLFQEDSPDEDARESDRKEKNASTQEPELPFREDQIHQLLASPVLMAALKENANLLIQEIVDDYIAEVETEFRNRLGESLEQILRQNTH